MKRICCIALVATTVFAQSPQTPNHGTPAQEKQSTPAQQLPFSDARNMTVIVTYAPPAAVPQPAGSGVWIGQRGYVLTCWHVVKSHPSGWRIVVLNSVPYVSDIPVAISTSVMIETQIVAYDKDADIAILKANSTPAEVGPTELKANPGSDWPASFIPQTPMSPKGANFKPSSRPMEKPCCWPDSL
jgi:S1-C subfamily serine protease